LLPLHEFQRFLDRQGVIMRKTHHKHAVHFRWGDFHLDIVGRRTILWWAAGASFLVGLKVFATKLF
jgi:hypothetical protein